jgi:hypothetical protein
MGKKIIKI